MWVPPPCPQASGPPPRLPFLSFRYSGSTSTTPSAREEQQGGGDVPAGWEGGGHAGTPGTPLSPPWGPPAPLRAGGPPAPLTHGVHHVDVVHEVPLPQVDRELRGHERDSGVRAAPNPCPKSLSPPRFFFFLGGGETEARGARASPGAGLEEEIWAQWGGPRAHAPLLTPQWGLQGTFFSPPGTGTVPPPIWERLYSEDGGCRVQIWGTLALMGTPLSPILFRHAHPKGCEEGAVPSLGRCRASHRGYPKISGPPQNHRGDAGGRSNPRGSRQPPPGSVPAALPTKSDLRRPSWSSLDPSLIPLRLPGEPPPSPKLKP